MSATPTTASKLAIAAGTDTERRASCYSLEVRAVTEGGKSKLTGYAAVYNVRSNPIGGSYYRFYEIVRPGAFKRALTGIDDVRCLVEHGGGLQTIGRTKSGTLRLSEDTRGLKFECDPPDTTAGKDIVSIIQRGDISQMSFGFRKLKDNWYDEKSPDGTMCEVRELLEVELFDVSPVTFPAYEPTEVALRSRDAAMAMRNGDPATIAARLRLAEAAIAG